MLNGVKKPVPDGAMADFAIVAARTGSTGRDSDISLFLVEMKAEGVEAKVLTNIDPSRGQAELTFRNCKAEPLGAADEGWGILSEVLDRAAVLMAFEQVGGADRALEMGRDYALDRIAFGRPIGSFQAVKHMLADMYVSATLARSNCYYGAWALSTNASELPEAAAAARISATQAFQLCAKNNIQVPHVLPPRQRDGAWAWQSVLLGRCADRPDAEKECGVGRTSFRGARSANPESRAK
jgi:alkylation response protein AidB-like acyl-CoA dehydrogenase